MRLLSGQPGKTLGDPGGLSNAIVTVSCVCHPARAEGCPESWGHVLSGRICGGASGPTNICFHRLTICPRQRGRRHPIRPPPESNKKVKPGGVSLSFGWMPISTHPRPSELLVPRLQTRALTPPVSLVPQLADGRAGGFSVPRRKGANSCNESTLMYYIYVDRCPTGRASL